MIVYGNCFSSAAGFQSALSIKRILPIDLDGLETFAHDFPDTLMQFADDNKIPISANDRAHILKLILGFFGTRPEKFKWHIGEKAAIMEIVSIVKDLTANSDYSKFRKVRATTPTTRTPIGLLFSDKVNETQKKRRVENRETSLRVDETSYEELTKFITECCKKKTISFLKETAKDPAEKKFMSECGVDSIDAHNVNITFDISDLKRVMSYPMSEQKMLTVDINCYCKSMLYSCPFRVNAKLERLFNDGKLGEAGKK